MKMIDIEIENMIMSKYDKDPIKREHFINKWKGECKAEEYRSSEKWQEKDAEIRSEKLTLKTNADTVQTQSIKRKHKVSLER